MEMAKIGATARVASAGLALTDLDRQARDLFIELVPQGRLHDQIDKMGNIFARRAVRMTPGAGHHRQPYRQPADRRQVRRHLRRALRTRGHPLAERLEIRDHPADRSVGLDQRGRLALRPGHGGLRRLAGVFDLEYGLAAPTPGGKTMGEELQRIGYAGDRNEVG
jgi:N-carbamoyl-L-amino-acid hydrolase